MSNDHGQPWWKFGHVWMVIAGPAVVVVASFITLYLAIKTPDPVDTSYGRGSASQAAKPDSPTPPNMAPAMQARNHAATGTPLPAQR
ncbi:MAG: nitrogen fixation protein FixH [Polaromonas sp.]